MAIFEGNKAIKQAREEAAAADRRREQGSFRRFRLTPGERATVTFIDIPDKGAWEHSIKKSEKIWEPEWCLNDEAGRGGCQRCAAGIPRSFVLIGTVINHNRYESKKDPSKVYENQKQYIVLKGRGQQAMLEYLDPESPVHQDMTYRICSIKRPESSTSCGCGEVFTPGKKVNLNKLKAMAKEGTDAEEFIKPLDYLQIIPKPGDTTGYSAAPSGLGGDNPFADLAEDDEEETSQEKEEEEEGLESLL